jgi:ArsR family transcriptional regulator, virulence genes transcriptional regulator
MTDIDLREAKVVRRNAAEAAGLLRTLAHEARLAVLCELVGRERTAGALVEASGLSQSALSQHLAKLRQEGIVATRREGQTIYYRLADPRAERLIATLYQLFCRGK